MFRYSRDVKRCGPGTKAGAPVGVVYCLSTSSFFILTLTLELDVSAFGIAVALQHVCVALRRPTVRTFGLVTASRIIAKPRTLSGDLTVNTLPRCSRVRTPPAGGRCRYQAFLDSMAARASA